MVENALAIEKASSLSERHPGEALFNRRRLVKPGSILILLFLFCTENRGNMDDQPAAVEERFRLSPG